MGGVDDLRLRLKQQRHVSCFGQRGREVSGHARLCAAVCSMVGQRDSLELGIVAG